MTFYYLLRQKSKSRVNVLVEKKHSNLSQMTFTGRAFGTAVLRFLSRLAGCWRFVFVAASAFEFDHFLDNFDQLTSVLVDHFRSARLFVLFLIRTLTRPEERTTRRQRTARAESSANGQASSGTHETILPADGQAGAGVVRQQQNDGQHCPQSYEFGRH